MARFAAPTTYNCTALHTARALGSGKTWQPLDEAVRAYARALLSSRCAALSGCESARRVCFWLPTFRILTAEEWLAAGSGGAGRAGRATEVDFARSPSVAAQQDVRPGTGTGARADAAAVHREARQERQPTRILNSLYILKALKTHAHKTHITIRVFQRVMF